MHSNIASTSYLDGIVDCFHFLGFQPRKQIGVLICNTFFWITFQGVWVFGNILYLSNMVSELLWISSIGDRNLELVFPYAWKDLWFFIFLWILWNMCSIESRAMLSVRNTFLFVEKGFYFHKIRPFYNIQIYTIYDYTLKKNYHILSDFSMFFILFLVCYLFNLCILFATQSMQT